MIFLRFALTIVLLGLAPGCVINQDEQRVAMQQQREDNLILQEDLRRMRARLDALEDDLQQLSQQVNAANSDQSRNLQAQMQAYNTALDDLRRSIRSVESAREQDKKDIVDRISRDVAAMLKQQASRPPPAPAPRRPISDKGYEHVVEQGETLSAIAKAYSVSSADIMAANNLQSADMLRIGQKLFIPAP